MEEQMKNYLASLMPPEPSWVQELKAQANTDKIPIMEDASMQLLMQLIRIKQPDKILEIGTAIGYSALRMSQAYPDAHIITLEKDDIRYNQAVVNIAKLNKENVIHPVLGDALEEMEKYISEGRRFDCIFIDAAKGQYKHFFTLADKLLNHQGMIVTDNVLFRGFVAIDQFEHPRYQKMVAKIKSFNQWLCQLSDYETSIIPVGDGVAISCKKS
ncbi:O-methyltransferase [Virgibacillus sp. 179-BFC.A HS]|uniref:tRNA 5-hydroxyuridine methyltransferase n=1 Tax=Tigheibacillus jepli TaxID=3035914 RepID=A0ABU5CGN7_9BACI|nr:O-methyltransferase [Virgibacillus sp. 179-BFC.A HS]MDY0405499.1 O-methyltransferase [Virgibacillus sp. 179-BFC.A HS]